MYYSASAVTDVGTRKQTNQDGICIRVANTKEHGQVAMAVICDGMGGLSKGEVASATVVRMFSNWFERVVSQGLFLYSMEEISEAWKRMLREENRRILEFGRKIHVNIGTTCSALFLMGNEYVIAHVGDTRIYAMTGEAFSPTRVTSDTICSKGRTLPIIRWPLRQGASGKGCWKGGIRQLTLDQTYVAREVRLGNMTPEQARTHAKRSVLLQCVGASREVEPQVVLGEVRAGTVFLLCSDGFRHVLSEGEMYKNLYSVAFGNAKRLERNSKKLVKLVKERGEKDNISVAVIQCEESRELSSAAEVEPSMKMFLAAEVEPTMKMFLAAEPGRLGNRVMASNLEQTAELPTLKPKNLEITEILQSITMVHADEVISDCS